MSCSASSRASVSSCSGRRSRGSAHSARARKYATCAARTSCTTPWSTSRSMPYSRSVSSIRNRGTSSSASSTRCSSDLSTSPESRSAVTTGSAPATSGPATARALSAVTPPGQTATRSANARSGGSSRSQLHATTARSVWCRGRAARLPPISSRNRSPRRSATCWTDRVRSRAAASSIASGRPSSRAQVSQTASTVSASRVKSGRTACGPVDEQRHATAPPARPRRTGPPGAWAAAATGHSASPVMPSGSRLVASTRSRGARASSSSTSTAAAPTRCSQLSRTSSSSRSAERLDETAGGVDPLPGGRFDQAGLAQPERADQRAGQLVRVGDRGQLGHPDAVGQDAGERARPPRWPAWSCPPRPAPPG